MHHLWQGDAYVHKVRLAESAMASDQETQEMHAIQQTVD
jgi:hypothetical protein